MDGLVHYLPASIFSFLHENDERPLTPPFRQTYNVRSIALRDGLILAVRRRLIALWWWWWRWWLLADGGVVRRRVGLHGAV
jgi:hypothetical protein